MNIRVKAAPDFDVIVFVYVKPTDSVDKLKDIIEDKIGVPCDVQKLLFRDKVLEKGVLSDFNIVEGSIVLLERKIFHPIQIVVKNLTGKDITMNIKQDDFIEDLKAMIKEEEGYKPDEQRLFCNGKNLENGHKLSYYDIEQGSVIELKLAMCRPRSCTTS